MKSNPIRSFASDNNAGVHPEVLQALAAANTGHTVGYGDDVYTERARAKFREHFGDVEVFFRSGLQRARNAGLIEPAIRTDVMAEILLGAVLAIRVLARLDPDRSRLRRLADHALLPLTANNKANC